MGDQLDDQLDDIATLLEIEAIKRLKARHCHIWTPRTRRPGAESSPTFWLHPIDPPTTARGCGPWRTSFGSDPG